MAWDSRLPRSMEGTDGRRVWSDTAVSPRTAVRMVRAKSGESIVLAILRLPRLQEMSLESRSLQSRTGFHDIGDQISDAQSDGGFDGAIEVHDLGLDTVFCEVAADQVIVGGAHSLARNVCKGCHLAERGCETESGAGKTQSSVLDRARARVKKQIPAGDACLDGTTPHVHGDVSGTQEEEFNIVR